MNIYDEYKESGIEWIGQIPKHWEIKRNKYLFSYKKGKNPKNLTLEQTSDEDFIYLSMDYLRQKKNSITFYSKNEDYVLVNDSDLLLLWDGSKAGEFILGKKGILSSTMVKIFPKKIISKNYLHFLSNEIQRFIQSKTIGMGIPHISSEVLSNMKCGFPPLQEQEQIANYLDIQTQKIDKLIENTQNQIKQLKEYEKSLINKVVTKGLNENVELKDSNIEWIGKIPKHWQDKRLKQITYKIGSGVTPKGGSLIYLDKGIPLIRSQNVHFDGLKLEDVAYISNEIYNKMINVSIKKFDILLNITGASIGRCFYFLNQFEKGVVNQHVAIIRSKNIFYKFLNYCISSNLIQNKIQSQQDGSSREGLNFFQLGNFKITYPPLEEQKEIAEYLDNKTIKIQTLIKNKEKQVQLYQELRKTIINNGVTGKVKVY